MNETPTNTIVNTKMFSAGEVKQAENMLVILAHISAEYWAKALMSEYFIPGGKLYDHCIGYKNRVTKIVADPNVPAITFEQISKFKEEYLNFVKEQIDRYIKSDICIAMLLDKQEKVHIPLGYGFSDISFGGWDNDPSGAVAHAMKLADIHGKMNGGYTKTRITLLTEDGTIREGWFTWQPVLCKVR